MSRRRKEFTIFWQQFYRKESSWQIVGCFCGIDCKAVYKKCGKEMKDLVDKIAAPQYNLCMR